LHPPARPVCPGSPSRWVGGEAPHWVIPNEVMEQDCLRAYDGKTYFEASLFDPLSCVFGAFNANYLLQEGSYTHTRGIRPQGRT
ncbi:L-sorbose 1-phosphate reductase, partial [Escherichia coli]|nr:L-sorbose 1-phosphate reductase [Escherichia coli]